MRLTVLLLIIATALAACGDVAIVPADPPCAGDPASAQGSGCDDGGG